MSTGGSPSEGSGIIEQLFYTKRINDTVTKLFIIFYIPIGITILTIRTFIGFYAFLIACLLRKFQSIRSVVIRLMCALMGIVLIKKGKQNNEARVLVSNHVSILDHLAIDLLSPCLLPSVWDIPTLIRWCFGYVDLGASRGRNELIKNARETISKNPLPLLAFPEGVKTSGQTALIKFNSWCFEISHKVQPISINVYRPVPWNVAPSTIGSIWWTDLLYFFALPFTVITVNYLPTVIRKRNENVEKFSQRVAKTIADELKIVVSKFETREAAEAEKRWKRDIEMSRNTKKENKIYGKAEEDTTDIQNLTEETGSVNLIVHVIGGFKDKEKCWQLIDMSKKIRFENFAKRLEHVTRIPTDFQTVVSRSFNVSNPSLPLLNANNFDEIKITHSAYQNWIEFLLYARNARVQKNEKKVPEIVNCVKSALPHLKTLDVSDFFAAFPEYESFSRCFKDDFASFLDTDDTNMEIAIKDYFAQFFGDNPEYPKISMKRTEKKLNGIQGGFIAHILRDQQKLGTFFVKVHIGLAVRPFNQNADLRELYAYKFMEFLGVGPRVHFIPNSHYSSLGLYIATAEVFEAQTQPNAVNSVSK